jgi:transcriptional regulator with GAF, ATPase, and Fis domain
MGRDPAAEPDSNGVDGLTFGDRIPSIHTAVEALIQEALKRSEGNQAIAAGILGLTPQALSKRLHRKQATG